MTERILVTGGTGFIGRAVVTALAGDGHRLTVLTRDPGRARTNAAPNVEYARFDISEPALLAGTLDGAKYVVNLAGAPLFKPFTGRRYLRKVTQDRIEVARSLVHAIKHADVPPVSMINASSVGVYGFGASTTAPVDEESAALPGAYASGSMDWEEAATVHSSTRSIFMRLGFVLSGTGGGLEWQLQSARKGKVSYFAPGTQWLPWVHLDDVVGFVRRAVSDESWTGAYNLVSPHPPTSREFAENLAEVTAAAPPRRSSPVAARIWMGAGADIMLGGRHVVPARLIRAGFTFRHPTLVGSLRACVNETRS